MPPHPVDPFVPFRTSDQVFPASRVRYTPRLVESVRLVCRMGEANGWQWHERYHAQKPNRLVVLRSLDLDETRPPPDHDKSEL